MSIHTNSLRRHAMTRAAYATSEPIHIPRLVDMAAVRRGLNSLAMAVRRAGSGVARFISIWYL